MNEVERMLIRLVGDGSSYFRMMDLAEKDLVRFAKIADRETTRITKEISSSLDSLAGKFMSVGKAATIFGGVLTAMSSGVIAAGLMSATAFEQTKIAFGTMLGSADAAMDVLADLTKFAADTPFEMPEIEQAARGLIMFGETGDHMMETLKILGDAASGTSSRFGEIALIFNQVRGVGKLLTQDFRQLSTRGVISLQDIAKHFGVTTEEAQKMLSTGKVGFEDLRNILKALSDEGGRFANMMEKQSKTLGGLWSTLKDNINIVTREIGEQFLPIAKTVVQWALDLATYVQELSPGTKRFIAAIIGLVAILGVMITIAGTLLISLGALAASVSALVGFITTFGAAAAVATVAATAFTLALSALAVVIVGLLAYKAGSNIAEFFDIGGAKELNAELEKMRDLNHQIAIIQQQGFNETFKGIEDRTGEDKRVFAEEEMARAQNDLKGLERQISLTKKEAEELKPTWKSLWMWESGNPELTLKKLDEIKQRVTNQKGFITKLQEQIDAMPKPFTGPDPEDVAKSEKYVENLKEQLSTLGMTKDEAYLYKLETQGISQAIIKETEALQQQLATKKQAAEEAAKLDKSVRSLRENLQQSIATWGMTSDEVERYKLEQAGASSMTLKGVEALQKKLALLKKEKEITDAVSSTIKDLTRQIATVGMDEGQKKLFDLKELGVTDADLAKIEDLQKDLKIKEDHQALMEEGKSLTESLMTKEEQRAAKVDNLNKLLAAGAISQQTYSRAMEEMAKASGEATQAYEDYQRAISGGREFDTSFEGLTKDLTALRGGAPPEAVNPNIIPFQRAQDLNANNFAANQQPAQAQTSATGKSSVEILAAILDAIRMLVDKSDNQLNLDTIEKAA